MKLISNTSFGDFCRSKRKEFKIPLDYYQWYNKIRDNYDEFLKQSLNIGMLVPCDDEGRVLEHPIYTTNHSDECYCKECEEETKRFSDLQEKYEKAKEKVLFEGFEFKEYERMICFEKKGIEIFIYNKNYQTFSAPRGRIITIEDLIMYEFELTESAVKQIGL